MASDRNSILGKGDKQVDGSDFNDVGINGGDLSDDLPGTARADGNINWLGSSYSGADIKVVAHLYGELDVTTEEVRLKEELKFAEEMVDALEDLKVSSALMAFDGRINYSILVSEYGDNDKILRAIDSLLSSFDSINNSGARVTSILAAIEGNIGIFANMAENLKERLKRLESIRTKGSSTVTLATLQTISIQSHREKVPVRAFGSSNVKGFARGARTIAGSLIFTMFNEHALAQLMRSIDMTSHKYRYGEAQLLAEDSVSDLLTDQLPPLDLTIVFANEYGSLSRGALYGVEFMSDSQTYSIEDLLTEEVIQFVARDISPVVSEGNVNLSRDQRGMNATGDISNDQTASQLLFTSMENYHEHLKKIGIRRWFKNR